jgi:hypothetical protein
MPVIVSPAAVESAPFIPRVPALAPRTPLLVGSPLGFRAIALVWNSRGSWVVRTAPTFASASADAVQTCNNQFGGCTLSEVMVAPTNFGCLVVARGVDTSRVFAAAGDSVDAARTAVDAQVVNAGLRGEIVYSACNS